MNTRQVRQVQRGGPQKNFGNNQQAQAYTPQAVQKPAFQTNNASNASQQRQQAAPPVYQPSPIAQQPQRNAVNTSNLTQVPQVENPFAEKDNIKVEPANNVAMETVSSEEPPKFLHRTKKKASAREIRQRQNRRLRKLLTPKNALMALYELIGNKNCDFKINADAKGFLAEVLVNNVRYEGRGTSKTAAKNDASEKALRDLIIQKMVERPKKAQSADGNNETNDTDDVEMKDADANSVEVPMMHLASFALHKLFSEWQNEGFEIPDLKTTNPQEKVVSAKVSADKTDLPANYETMHPSMLLSMMRPNTQYVDLGSEGTTPNVVHRFGVTVDGQSFVGQDRTKKLARKAVAITACNTCFGTKFQQDEIRIVHGNKKEPEQ